MQAEDLREEIEIERMQQTLDELTSLWQASAEHEPTVVEKTAAGAFLAQLYSGIENIMKRISRFYGVALPEGAQWHDVLFQRFTEAGSAGLPRLFQADLARDLDVYRRFRHLFVHGYGIDLDWRRMQEGAESAPRVFGNVFAAIRGFLATL
jgi:hypothetical protein